MYSISNIRLTCIAIPPFAFSVPRRGTFCNPEGRGLTSRALCTILKQSCITAFPHHRVGDKKGSGFRRRYGVRHGTL